MASLVALLVLGATGVANAAAVRVSGTITELSPGSCSDFELKGRILSFHCDDMSETWAGGISVPGSSMSSFP